MKVRSSERIALGGHSSNCEGGFSLLELAIALALVGLLAGGGLLLLRRGVEQDLRAETQANIDEARIAMMGFLKVNGRLPWPNSSLPAGGEIVNPTAGSGYLPYLSLGVNPSDAWHRPIRYAPVSGLQSSPTAATYNIAQVTSCNALKQFFAGSYVAWPWLEDPSISASIVPVMALMVSGGARKNGDGTRFYDVKSATRSNTITPAINVAVPPARSFIRPLPGTVLPTGGVYDDILVTLDPATLYQWALCTPPLP